MASRDLIQAASGVVLTKAQREILTDMLKGAAFLRFDAAKPLSDRWLIVPCARTYRGARGRWFDITSAGRATLADADTTERPPEPREDGQ